MTVYKTPTDRNNAREQGRQITRRLLAELERCAIALESLDYLSRDDAYLMRRNDYDAQGLPAIFLARAAAQGLDSQFVITGTRSANWPPAAGQTGDAE